MVAILTENELLQKIKAQPIVRPYYAMYSSLWGGIVRDPRWMMIPIDDHMVHRGDGVFEAIKFINRKIYLLSAHLDRLFASAERIDLKPYAERAVLQSIIEATVAAGSEENGLIRVFLSRGPGSFSVNPYDTEGTQFFVIVTALAPPPAEKFDSGVSIGRSQVPVKETWMAQVKSCNYLPNVLMKKEAVDRKLDFVVAFDDEGFLAESATENIAIVTENGYLVKPKPAHILRGTTMARVFELAEKLISQQMSQIKLKGIESRNISADELAKAKEIMMLGTTLDVLPVTKYEGRAVADGQVGPVAKILLQALLQDQKN